MTMRGVHTLLTVLTGCVLGTHMLQWEIGPPIVNEYCQFEAFNVSCGERDVIMMDMAVYGRTEVGRCVSKAYDSLGCTVDLTRHMDSKCSGRHQCKVEVPDKTMVERSPCPKDLTSHLDASYRCIPVSMTTGESCYSSGQLDLNDPQGYLSSVVAQETGLGSKDCPWVIHALPGQRIQITLLDFYLPPGSSPGGANDVVYKPGKHSSYCHTYAIIREKRQTLRESPVCGEGERERVVYLSATNEVHVEMSKYKSKHKAPHFLLKFEALGCSELTPPVGGWLQQVDREATVGCNGTKGRRHLHCDGNRWVGTFPNCTSSQTSELGATRTGGGSSETMWTMLGEDWSSPVGILIVSALGVALGLLIGVAMLSVVLVFMKRNKRSCCSAEPDYEETVQDSDDHTVGYVLDNKTSSAIMVDQMELVNLNDGNTYGAMWRSRPPSYTPPTESSMDTQTTRVGYTSSSSMRSDILPVPPGFGGRIPEMHTYESPTVPRREVLRAPGDLPETEPS